MNFKRFFNFSSLLNVLGMTVAFASVYVLAVQINYALNYNHGIKDSERVYAITMPSWYEEGKWQSYLSRPACENFIGNIACVEAGGVCYPGNLSEQTTVYTLSGEEFRPIELSSSEFSEGALKVFSFDFVAGTLDAFRDGGKGLLVSEAASKKYGLHLGETLFLSEDKDSDPCSVSAIYKDFPLNSDLSGIELIANFGDKYIDNFSEWSFPYFVKLSSPEDKQTFEEQSFELAKKISDNDINASEEEREEYARVLTAHLVSIEDTYFDKTISASGEQGNKTTILTLILIAVLLIVVAFINYINFFFALIPTRIRGVNIRKILGSSRSSLVLSSVGESVLLICVSLVLAGIAAYLFGKSSFARLISCSIAFGDNIPIVLLVVVTGLVLSVVASIYPSLYITSFNPAIVLKGSFGSSSKGKALRYTLVGFQFVVALSLITCAVFIRLNHNYMMHKDIGIDRDCLLGVSVGGSIAGNREAAESALLSDPRIASLAWGDGNIIRVSRMGWTRMYNSERISFQCYPVSWNFLRFMGVEVVEGRDFTEADEHCGNGVFIFNESARDKYSLTLESKVQGHTDAETDIAGFCKDFHFRPMQYSIEPFCFYVMGRDPWRYPSHLYIRTTPGADVAGVIETVKSSLAELNPYFATHQADIRTFDEELGVNYSKEQDLSTLIGIFSLVSIVIVLMGLFGLVLFETQYRRKEIGIRRTQGAHIGDILLMFNKKFIYIVLICFVISVPITYFAINRYLQGFANHVPIYWWVFALVLLLVLAVTVAVVTLRSLGAAMENPVESVKIDS